MKKLVKLALAICLLVLVLLIPSYQTANAQCDPPNCQGGAICGTGRPVGQRINCGGGHDCIIYNCSLCTDCCCVADGGTADCTFCDISVCTLVVVSCV